MEGGEGKRSMAEDGEKNGRKKGNGKIERKR
jgi:hypothetical protein